MMLQMAIDAGSGTTPEKANPAPVLPLSTINASIPAMDPPVVPVTPVNPEDW